MSEIVLTRDPRLYEHCMVNGLPKMLDWSAGTMSGLPYELWVGGYDEGQNAALESGNYATGYKNMKYYLEQSTNVSIRIGYIFVYLTFI